MQGERGVGTRIIKQLGPVGGKVFGFKKQKKKKLGKLIFSLVKPNSTGPTSLSTKKTKKKPTEQEEPGWGGGF